MMIDVSHPVALAVLFATMGALVPMSLPAAEQIVSLETRPGVSVMVLIMTPTDPPSGTVLMFPGGDGKGHFGKQGSRVRLGGNFLVRSAPLFVEQGLVVAIVDTPSDQPNGMSDRWRTGKEHAEDTRKILEFVGKGSGPVAWVGASRGTLSAAYLATELADPRITGLVLTSSMSQPDPRNRWMTVGDLPLERITVPVLFVHHKSDTCTATPIAAARGLITRLKKSPRIEFVEVQGGDPPRSEPCQALSAHGFLGKEREVVAAISAWVKGQPVPKEIGN